MPTLSAHDQLDRARRTAMASELRVVRISGVWRVDEPDDVKGWKAIAWLVDKADLETFLTAKLPPPRDHV